MKGLKIWFLETRPQFLILSVILAFLGSVVAWYDGSFVLWKAFLAGLGLVLAHASVNTLNDYFDYRSGIDLATQRTPYSGGSGVLPQKLLKPNQVLWLGIVTLVLAVPIGIYFIIDAGILLLPLLLLAAFFIILYSPFILKRTWPEWSAGAGLGLLPILGLYFAQTGEYTWLSFVAGVPSALLVHNLLLLNEFPDVDADKTANRRTMPISHGKRRAGRLFTTAAVATYLWIIGFAIGGILPYWTLLGLLTVPMMVTAIKGALNPDDIPAVMAGMKANVQAILLTQLLIGIGFVIAALV